MDHDLYVLWTTGEPETAKKMVLLYAHNSLLMNWWQKVTLIIWGASAKLAAEDREIQEMLVRMISDGVQVKACKACADQLGVAEALDGLGIEVKYWGHPLTELIQSGKHMIII